MVVWPPSPIPALVGAVPHDPVINNALIPPAESECGVFDPVALFSEDYDASHGIDSADGVFIPNKRQSHVAPLTASPQRKKSTLSLS